MSDVEDEGDWDKEFEALNDQDLIDDTQNNAEIYTMVTVGGMTTISPATARDDAHSKPVKAEVEWVYDADSVAVRTSFDDFNKAYELTKQTVNGRPYFHATIMLPPGRYLLRYLVDGEWMIDDNQEVVYSLGNEYNSLVVSDPNDEGDESDADSDDLSEFDDVLPDNFVTGSQYTADLFGDIDPSSGMVTISPAMAAQATKALEEKNAAAAAAQREESSRASLRWDGHRGAFVMSKDDDSDNDDGGGGDATEQQQQQGAVFSSDKKKKDRERRRKKKKKRRDRQRQQQQQIGQNQGVRMMHEEIMRREQEWREAWVVHELKTQQAREAEKAQMRQQWKEERDQWIIKIKSYANESNQLRNLVNEAHSRLDEAESTKQLLQKQFDREKAQMAEQIEFLKSESEKYKSESEKMGTELSGLQGISASTHTAIVEQKDKLEKEMSALVSENSKLKSAVETTEAEKKTAEEESAALKAKIESARAEFEQSLKAKQSEIVALQGDIVTLKSQAQSQTEATAADAQQRIDSLSDEVKSAQQRASDLSMELDSATSQRKDLEEQLANATKSLTDTKSALAEAQSQLSGLKAEHEGLKADHGGLNSKIDDFKSRLEAAAAAAASKEAGLQAKLKASEEQLAKAREDAGTKQQSLDAALTEAEKAASALADAQSKFAREREELERRLAASASKQETLQKAVNDVTQDSKNVRASVKETRTAMMNEVSVMKHGIDEFRKFLLDSVSTQSQALQTIMKKYKKELSERRKYFNLCQELKGNIRVFCRVRPVISHDQARDAKVAVTFPDDNVLVLANEEKKRNSEYEFDRVFGFDSKNSGIFEETKSLVQSTMDGYNVCIFAYGQTGSGKTHTMVGYGEDPGINMRALKELFALKEQRQGDYKYKISVSMLEIYNEKIRDLLNAKQSTTASLKVHKGPQGMYVDGLTEQAVETEDDVVKIMEAGNNNRATNVTDLNEHSSRSHSILSVKVVGHNLTAGITYYGKLHLIDLAGSERVSKSGASGQRMKEAQAINKSLSALGNVIEALQKKTSHVPYRDSKLTFLLQDSLGGHAKTLMFINVSPIVDDADESFCSLNFATRVRRVELGTAVRTIAKEGGAKKK